MPSTPSSLTRFEDGEPLVDWEVRKVRGWGPIIWRADSLVTAEWLTERRNEESGKP